MNYRSTYAVQKIQHKSYNCKGINTFTTDKFIDVEGDMPTRQNPYQSIFTTSIVLTMNHLYSCLDWFLFPFSPRCSLKNRYIKRCHFKSTP